MRTRTMLTGEFGQVEDLVRFERVEVFAKIPNNSLMPMFEKFVGEIDVGICQVLNLIIPF
jgi:hypothetical protein